MVVYIHGYIGDSVQMNELNFNLHSLHSTGVPGFFLLVEVSCLAGWIYSQRNISAWHKLLSTVQLNIVSKYSFLLWTANNTSWTWIQYLCAIVAVVTMYLHRGSLVFTRLSLHDFQVYIQCFNLVPTLWSLLHWFFTAISLQQKQHQFVVLQHLHTHLYRTAEQKLFMFTYDIINNYYFRSVSCACVIHTHVRWRLEFCKQGRSSICMVFVTSWWSLPAVMWSARRLVLLLAFALGCVQAQGILYLMIPRAWQ